MNPELAGESDLREWADRNIAREQLPILLRRLILATTGMDLLRAPGGDAVGEHGWDIRLDTTEVFPPFIPQGQSRWEGGVGEDPRAKAQSDFRKRTEQTPADERKNQTFVFFTPRHFKDSEDWLEAKAKENHGWADIKVIDGVILAEWLEKQPAVHIWFSELIGKLPIDVAPLDTWWTSWSEATSPATPTGLVLAGRNKNARALRASLRAMPIVLEVAADTTDEAVAFVAAALHDDPPIVVKDTAVATDHDADSAPRTDAPTVTSPSASMSPVDASDLEPSGEAEEMPTRSALLARSVIVTSPAAWARVAQNATPMILIPTFDNADLRVAVAAGHHVIVPSDLRRRDSTLPRIRVDEAAAAWQSAGVDFRRSYDYARSARRNLSSLRRRLARAGQFRRPEWSDGTATSMLGPLVLLGAWREDCEADIELIEDFTDTRWRRLSRDLQAVGRLQDPPVRVQSQEWEFLDPADAWDLLADSVTVTDLEGFHARVLEVVTEPDPVLSLPPDEQHLAGIRGIRRKFSPALRNGMATTVAVLGAVVGDQVLQDGYTGQQHATVAVRDLLESDDPTHWVNVAPLLPTLAEASPTAFLDAVERAADANGSPLLALFDEGPKATLGSRGSTHHHLLWALEHLTFSDQYMTRALLMLARLAHDKPDLQSGNTPTATIVAALHLMHPQSAVTDVTRRDVLELLDQRQPDVAWEVMIRLITGTAGGTVFSASTPRWRDWPEPDESARTFGDVYAEVIEIVRRLAVRLQTDPGLAQDVVQILPHPPAAERQLLLDAIKTAASTMGDADRRVLADKLAELVNRHRQFPDALWSMPKSDVNAIADVATSLAPGIFTVPPVDWFSFWPRTADMAGEDVDVDELLDENRIATIRDVYAASGLAGVVELTLASEAKFIVGRYLAGQTDVADEDVFALGPSIDAIDTDSITQLVLGYAAERFAQRGIDWLREALNQADETVQPVLLRACGITRELLDLLATRPDSVQDAYWAHPVLFGVPPEIAQEYAAQLLDRDKAWSALIVVVSFERKQSVMTDDDINFALQVLESVRKTSEDPRGLLDHHVYSLGMLLDRLTNAGADQRRLAKTEYYLQPLFEHSRHPIALYRELAQDPLLFSSLIIGTFRRRSEPAEQDGTNETADDKTGHEAEDETEEDGDDVPVLSPSGDPAGFDDADLLDDRIARALWSRHGYSLLHSWPALPGQTAKHEVDIDHLRSWIRTVLATTHEHGRDRAGRQQVGQVLASPATDTDGTWPNQAVRDILEELNDTEVEAGLIIGRFNQRGVTVRSPYDGGDQERSLADTYQTMADALRHKWPRAGAILDQLANGYRTDANREDLNIDG